MLTVSVKFNQVCDFTMAVGRMTDASLQRSLVQGDTGPKLRFTLQDSNGVPLNVSGCEASLFLRIAHTSGHVNVGHEACSGVDPVNGVVVYDFLEGDLADAGTYFGDVQIIYADGSKETGFDPCRFLVRESNK